MLGARSRYPPSVSDFRVNLDEILFNLRHVADVESVASLEGFEHVEPDLVEQLLAEAARFAEEVVAPLNRIGDTEGARRLDDGSVATPTGFREAYRAYVDAGWGAVSADPEYGGGGFPHLVGLAIEEMFTTACMSWSLCPLLTQGAINLLGAFGTDEQKMLYLPRMTAGAWTGHHEPHRAPGRLRPRRGHRPGRSAAGRLLPAPRHQDLHHLRRARPGREHRPPRVGPDPGRGRPAPAASVASWCPSSSSGPTARPGRATNVLCMSIEHKLGIHASPTCVMAYGDGDGAAGFLVGDGARRDEGDVHDDEPRPAQRRPRRGGTSAERSYQQALAYARERRQGRAPGAPAGESSAIIDHPDVRRMLLDMRSSTSAMRGLAYRNAEAIDRASRSSDESQRARRGRAGRIADAAHQGVGPPTWAAS